MWGGDRVCDTPICIDIMDGFVLTNNRYQLYDHVYPIDLDGLP